MSTPTTVTTQPISKIPLNKDKNLIVEKIEDKEKEKKKKPEPKFGEDVLVSNYSLDGGYIPGNVPENVNELYSGTGTINSYVKLLLEKPELKKAVHSNLSMQIIDSAIVFLKAIVRSSKFDRDTMYYYSLTSLICSIPGGASLLKYIAVTGDSIDNIVKSKQFILVVKKLGIVRNLEGNQKGLSWKQVRTCAALLSKIAATELTFSKVESSPELKNLSETEFSKLVSEFAAYYSVKHDSKTRWLCPGSEHFVESTVEIEEYVDILLEEADSGKDNMIDNVFKALVVLKKRYPSSSVVTNAFKIIKPQVKSNKGKNRNKK